MPEGDTIHRAAARLTPRSRARESSAPTRRTRARRSTAAPPSSQGATLEAVEARGKHLLAHFSGGARRCTAIWG